MPFDWGKLCWEAVTPAFRTHVDRHIGGPHTLKPLSIGTDFSGCEAPIFAMKSLGVKHTHVFSCDNAKRSQVLVKQNCQPQQLFSDIFARKTTPPHEVYVAGFPCTPFSRLHNHSKMLRDSNAKQMRQSFAVVRASQPKLVVFENVMGFLRCYKSVLPKMRALGYEVFRRTLCPTHFGEPVSRPRVYFILVRTDVLKAQPSILSKAMDASWANMKRPMTSLQKRLSLA